MPNDLCSGYTDTLDDAKRGLAAAWRAWLAKKRQTAHDPLENVEQPMIQRSLRRLLVAHGLLQVILESFEQVANCRRVTAAGLPTLHHLAPIGDQPLALCNATIGVLQASAKRIKVIELARACVAGS